MTNLSQNIKNGQQFNAPVGSLAIAAGDVLVSGGPGNEVWSAATADYAAVAPAGPILSQTSLVASALPGTSRQPIARDKLGNIYIASTNSSGNLVVRKLGPTGTVIGSVVLDATATSINTAYLFQLQNGSYACVYARASGALYFVVFDSALSLVAGPVNIATEFHTVNVVYHAACALSGGGFAVVFQTNAGTGISLATYTNAGAVQQAATNIQTLAGAAAAAALKVGQLSTGNLVVGFRSTMTAAAITGTGFVIVSVAGAAVAGPVNLDTTATLGFVELSILTAGFAIAVANGTNLIAAVFNNVGTQQNINYSVGTTLNSVIYPQVKLTNDGNQFWLVWFSSVANGLYVVGINVAGVVGGTASSLGVATLAASTFALDVEAVNGLLVALAASSGTGGQYLMTVGLPDTSLGIINPYVRSAPAIFGTAAAATGTNWPRLLSGGAGLYQGANPVSGQPIVSPKLGDFTVIIAYDQQSVAGTFIGIQKVEASAVVGNALVSTAANSPGSSVSVNPGPGDYPTNTIAGTSGAPFNHVGKNPSGTLGALYTNGMVMGTAAAFPTAGAVVPGSAQLTYSGPTSLLLVPFNGNTVPVAGTAVNLPSSGVSLTNSGVTINGTPNQTVANSTAYYVAIGLTGQLELWTLGTGRTRDTTFGNVGVQIVTGHADKTLVGLVVTDAGGNFSSALTRSWFARPGVQLSSAPYSLNAASGTIIEIGAAARVSFACFSDDFIILNAGGFTSLNNTSETDSKVGVDGTPVGPSMKTNFGSPFTGIPYNNTAATVLSDGVHVASLFGDSGTGTGTWNGTTQVSLSPK